MSDALYEALVAIRDAADPAAPSLGSAWRQIGLSVDRYHRLDDRLHDDVRQRVLLKVLKHVGSLTATSPGQARAWLARVHRSAHVEHLRQAGERLVQQALRNTPSDDTGHLDRIEAAPPGPEGRDEERALDEALERTLDRVHRLLAATVKSPTKRAGDYRRAQVALLANVRGLSVDELRSELQLGDSVARDTLYKWIERGREQILLPALESWDDPLAAALQDVLREARRADAGRARPQRRTRAVSPGGTSSSGKRDRDVDPGEERS